MKKYKLLIALVAVLVVVGVSLAFTANGNLQGFIFDFKNLNTIKKIDPKILNAKPDFSKFVKFSLPSLNDLAKEEPSQEWKDDFDMSINILFYPYVDAKGYSHEFTETEKNLIKKAMYRAVHTMDRISKYFKKPLPWTDGKSYFDWINDTVKEFAFYASPSESGGAASFSEKTIFLSGYKVLKDIESGAFEAFSYPFPELIEKYGVIGWIDIITHEARHLNGPVHSSCRGSDNMDTNLRMMGAHGVNVLWRHWVKNLLPSQMLEKAMLENSESLRYESFIGRMCSLDTSSGLLELEDQQFVINASGIPLDYDTDIIWH